MASLGLAIENVTSQERQRALDRQSFDIPKQFQYSASGGGPRTGPGATTRATGVSSTGLTPEEEARFAALTRKANTGALGGSEREELNAMRQQINPGRQFKGQTQTGGGGGDFLGGGDFSSTLQFGGVGGAGRGGGAGGPGGGYSQFVSDIMGITGETPQPRYPGDEPPPNATPEQSAEWESQMRDWTVYQQGEVAKRSFETDWLTQTPEYQKMMEAVDMQKELVSTQQQQLSDMTSQYDQLRQDFASRDDELTQYLEGLGDEERRRLEKQRTTLKATQKEDLMRRGLTSTTALNAALRGVDQVANESLGAMEERLRKQKLDYRSQFSGETLAAQERAINFGAQSAQANFAAGQAVPGTLSELAQMLANQRMAKYQQEGSLTAAALSAGASMYGAEQSAAASRYASTLGYKGDIAGLQQREAESKRGTELEAYKTQQSNKLGYAGLQNQYAMGQMSAKAQVSAASQPYAIQQMDATINRSRR